MLMDMPKDEVRNGDQRLDFLIGINIDGAPCGTIGKPDMYIPIQLHETWINERILEN